MPKISVIMPTYNVEKYLASALESVINQTFGDIEIICINDGSTDNSLHILEDYAAKDKRIKIINKENSGYGASMNIALKQAKGEYISIVETDDFIEFNMLERLYEIALKYDLDIARCQYFQFNSANNTNAIADNAWVPKNEIINPLEKQIVFYQAPAIWCNLIKKNLVVDNDIRFLETPGASYQDTSFAFKLYACSKRFMMIPDALLHYRIDNTNSSVNSKNKIFCVNTEYSEIKKFSKKNKIYNKVRKLIPKIKYGCYKWNYERLNKKFQLAFLLRWSLENIIDFVQGNIDKKLFTSNEYFKIIIITFFPFIYLLRSRR